MFMRIANNAVTARNDAVMIHQRFRGYYLEPVQRILQIQAFKFKMPVSYLASKMWSNKAETINIHSGPFSQ